MRLRNFYIPIENIPIENNFRFKHSEKFCNVIDFSQDYKMASFFTTSESKFTELVLFESSRTFLEDIEDWLNYKIDSVKKLWIENKNDIFVKSITEIPSWVIKFLSYLGE